MFNGFLNIIVVISSKSSHFKNLFNKLILTFFRLITPLLLIPFVYRSIEPFQMGHVDYAISFVSYFYIIGDFGLSMYGIREIASNRGNNRIISELYSLRNTINFVVLLFYLIVLYFEENTTVFYYLLICIFNISANFVNVEWVNEAYEKFSFITWKTILVRGLYVIAVFFFVSGQYAAIYYLLLTGFSIFLNNLISFIYVKKKYKFKFSLFLLNKENFKNMFFVFLTINSGVLFFQLDKLYLGNLNRFNDVSFYAFGERIIMIVVMLVSAGISFLTPKLSLMQSEGANTKDLLQKNLNLICLFLMPISVGFLVVGEDLIRMLGGDNYLSTSQIIPFISIIVVLYVFLEFMKINIFIVFKNEKYYSLIFFTMFFFSVLIKLVFKNLNFINLMSILTFMFLVMNLILFSVIYFKHNMYLNFLLPFRYILYSLPFLLLNQFYVDNVLLSLIFKVLMCISYYLCVLYLFKDYFVLRLLKKT